MCAKNLPQLTSNPTNIGQFYRLTNQKARTQVPSLTQKRNYPKKQAWTKI